MMGNPPSSPLKQIPNPISFYCIAPSPPWKTGTTWQPRPRPTLPLPCSPSRSPPAQSADPQKPPRRTGRKQHRFDSLGVNDQRFSIVFLTQKISLFLIFPCLFPTVHVAPIAILLFSNGRPALHSPTGRLHSYLSRPRPLPFFPPFFYRDLHSVQFSHLLFHFLSSYLY